MKSKTIVIAAAFLLAAGLCLMGEADAQQEPAPNVLSDKNREDLASYAQLKLDKAHEPENAGVQALKLMGQAMDRLQMAYGDDLTQDALYAAVVTTRVKFLAMMVENSRIAFLQVIENVRDPENKGAIALSNIDLIRVLMKDLDAADIKNVLGISPAEILTESGIKPEEIDEKAIILHARIGAENIIQDVKDGEIDKSDPDMLRVLRTYASRAGFGIKSGADFGMIASAMKTKQLPLRKTASSGPDF